MTLYERLSIENGRNCREILKHIEGHPKHKSIQTKDYNGTREVMLGGGGG